MQPARDLVAVLVELAARMQLGHDDLGRRNALALVDVDRNAAAVVAHAKPSCRHGCVTLTAVGMAGQRLVDAVVDDLIHHVVQARAVVGVADIHAGPLADSLQALENLDGIGSRIRRASVRLRSCGPVPCSCARSYSRSLAGLSRHAHKIWGQRQGDDRSRQRSAGCPPPGVQPPQRAGHDDRTARDPVDHRARRSGFRSSESTTETAQDRRDVRAGDAAQVEEAGQHAHVEQDRLGVADDRRHARREARPDGRAASAGCPRPIGRSALRISSHAHAGRRSPPRPSAERIEQRAHSADNDPGQPEDRAPAARADRRAPPPPPAARRRGTPP